jgi:hypothetical protein
MVKKRSTEGTSENLESRALVRASFELARSLRVTKLLVQADELRELHLVDRLRESEQVIWLTRIPVEPPLADGSNDAVLHLPETRLTQMSQLRIALLPAVRNGQANDQRSPIGKRAP